MSRPPWPDTERGKALGVWFTTLDGLGLRT